jgi:shikimate kinase
MKNNIALIGFMCAGKSSVGRALARRLRLHFVETDSLIEEKAGKSIATIFRTDGEAAFRRIESEVLAEADQMERTVISCGGGVVLNPANVENLRANAVTIFLLAGPDIILQRFKGSSEIRPLLNTADPALTITDLLKARQPLYEQAADIIIDTSGMSIDAIIMDIMTELDKYASLNLKK